MARKTLVPCSCCPNVSESPSATSDVVPTSAASVYVCYLNYASKQHKFSVSVIERSSCDNPLTAIYHEPSAASDAPRSPGVHTLSCLPQEVTTLLAGRCATPKPSGSQLHNNSTYSYEYLVMCRWPMGWGGMV